MSTDRKYVRKNPGAMVGKIARLPVAFREEINRRLLNGEPGEKILTWLNGQPEVLAVTRTLPGGGPFITHQNLSMWRKTGYAEFKRRYDAAEIANYFRG